jgi:hypothetical protein
MVDRDEEMRLAEEEMEEEEEEEDLLLLLLLLNADEEEEGIKKKRGGSVPGKKANLERDFEGGFQRIYSDYFSDDPLFPESTFRRRFRMSKELFLRITTAVRSKNEYFVRRRDAVGKWGAYGLQKFVAILRVLCYGLPPDVLEDYSRIFESTIFEGIQEFAKTVKRVFGPEYLRTPTVEDVYRTQKINAGRGFPGMFGSIDCRHWEWKNCPVGWQGQFRGKEKKPTVVTEMAVSGDLWIWHHHFGVPGSLNDINVLDQSPFLSTFFSPSFPRIPYCLGSEVRSIPYFLADGIYPSWAMFAKPIHSPQTPEQKHYTKVQEAVRKDAERAFGVLISRFKFLEVALRCWDISLVSEIVDCLVILHNMIVEERREEYQHQPYQWENFCGEDIINHLLDLSQIIEPTHFCLPPRGTIARFGMDYAHISDTYEFLKLQKHLMTHLWSLK